jgi:predicted dithiol-disulfide oxidoreductase (DUF899 family)
MADHKTGTRKEWLAARLELLEAEKELTRRGDDGCFEETYCVLRVVVHPSSS